MGESVNFVPTSLIFSIITLIESFAWGTLSFLAILCYNDIITLDTTNMHYGLQIFTENLYDFYLSSSSFSYERAVLPNTFYALMWLYFIISIFLFFSSGVQILVLSKKSKPRKVNLSTVIWQILTYTMCLYDLITCILFSVDFHFIQQNLSMDKAEDEIKLAVPMTLLILAAKGFILWILNLTLAIIISVLFKKKVVDEPILSSSNFKVDPEIYARNNVAYDAYGDNITASATDGTVKEENKPQSNKWFSKINDERPQISERGSLSLSSWGSFDSPDDTAPTTNTWSHELHTPRTRIDSYQTPRSLVASLSPSPIPAPTIEQTPYKTNNKEPLRSDYRSKAASYDYIDEVDDDDDDIMNAPFYLRAAHPTPRRFTLKEPTPDYN